MVSVGSARIAWVPHAGSQALFVGCPVYEALYHGTRGPGKTLGLLMDYAKDVGVGHGTAWRGILFRRTYKRLDDVVAKSREFFPRIFPGARFSESADKFKWIFPDGEELLFRHMNKPADYWNYHGHEYPWIGWEELTEWPDPTCYDLMKSCSRTSKKGINRRYRATTNPWGVGHNWVKRRFIDTAPAGMVIEDPETGLLRTHIWGHWSENRTMMAASPDYPSIIASAAQGGEAQKKAWIRGRWDIVAGGMFDDLWTPNVHLVKPFEVPKDWRIDRAGDWGESRPFSVGWWAENRGDRFALPGCPGHVCPRGSLFRIREWYGWDGKNPNVGIRMSATNVGRGIKEREEQWGIRGRVKAGPMDSAVFTVDDDGVSIAAKLKAGGADFLPSQKGPGSRKTRWTMMRDMLEAAVENDWERPHLHIFGAGYNQQWVRTVPVVPRDMDRDPDDIDTEAEDHAADETGYRVLRAKDRVAAVTTHEI